MSSLASISSTLTQRVLSQSNNISYAARGAYRMNSVPEDRKADYLFRDFYMVLVTGVLTELGFRMADVVYGFPKMTKALELNQLAELYKPGYAYGNFGDNIKNYSSIEQISELRKRLTGSLVNADSSNLIPELLDKVDFQKLSPEARKEMDVLVHHLRRRLNFDGARGYLENLVESNHLTGEQVERVKKALDGIAKAETMLKDLKALNGLANATAPVKLKPEQFSAVQKAIQHLTGHSGEQAWPWMSEVLAEKVADKELAVNLQPGEWQTFLGKLEALPSKIKSVLPESLAALVDDGLKSKTLVAELKKAQKNSFWPKMFGSIFLSLIFYGVIASILDNKLIQPWQKKLYEKRGTTSEVIAPAYWALIPGGAALAATMSDKIAPKAFQKLGYVNRFLASGVLSMGVYSAAAGLMIWNRLRKPPAVTPMGAMAPVPPPAFNGQGTFSQPLQHPQLFRQFEHATKY